MRHLGVLPSHCSSLGKKKKKEHSYRDKKGVLSGNSRSASCQQLLDKMENEAEWKELE